MALSKQEWQRRRHAILRGWARGMTNRAIAKRMNVSHSSVKDYVKRIYAETGVHSQAGSLADAYRRGWLQCPCGAPEGWGQMLIDAQRVLEASAGATPSNDTT